MMPVIRRGSAEDLEAIAAIQYHSEGASQWNPPDYLAHDLYVAIQGSRVAGFVAARAVAPDEIEILNLAVAKEFRRQGIGGALLKTIFRNWKGAVFLEVRASNEAAIKFYKYLGFQEVSRRTGYYDSPPETAIVMKFHSC